MKSEAAAMQSRVAMLGVRQWCIDDGNLGRLQGQAGSWQQLTTVVSSDQQHLSKNVW
jgi:hypothetical protein